jgi:uncharacterized protein YegL
MVWPFSKDKKNKAPAATPTAAPKQSGDLVLKTKQQVQKHQQALGLVLKQKNLAVTKARVVVVMDTSGSMQSDFNNGTIQAITERLLPMGLEFDDDGEIEYFIFSNDVKEISSVNINNITGFVDNTVIPKIIWGGTNYSPAIRKITKVYGIKNPSKDPTFVIFMTDGDNWDKEEARQALIKASEYNIFWKFVGIGNASMPFLEELDNMQGRKVDNANFVQIKNINKMKDSELYTKLLEEYGEWTAGARFAGIL